MAFLLAGDLVLVLVALCCRPSLIRIALVPFLILKLAQLRAAVRQGHRKSGGGSQGTRYSVSGTLVLETAIVALALFGVPGFRPRTVTLVIGLLDSVLDAAYLVVTRPRGDEDSERQTH